MNNTVYSADHWLFLLRMVFARLDEHDSKLCSEDLAVYAKAVEQVIMEMEDIRALIARVEAAGTEAQAGLGTVGGQGHDSGHCRKSGTRRAGPR